MILISTIYEKANKSRGIKHQVYFRSRDTKELGLEPVELSALMFPRNHDEKHEKARLEDAKNIEERIKTKYRILHKSRVDGYDGSSVSVFVCESLDKNFIESKERFLFVREENLTEHSADRLYVRTDLDEHQGDRGIAHSRANLEAQITQGYRIFVELSSMDYND